MNESAPSKPQLSLLLFSIRPKNPFNLFKSTVQQNHLLFWSLFRFIFLLFLFTFFAFDLNFISIASSFVHNILYISFYNVFLSSSHLALTRSNLCVVRLLCSQWPSAGWAAMKFPSHAHTNTIASLPYLAMLSNVNDNNNNIKTGKNE